MAAPRGDKVSSLEQAWKHSEHNTGQVDVRVEWDGAHWYLFCKDPADAEEVRDEIWFCVELADGSYDFDRT